MKNLKYIESDKAIIEHSRKGIEKQYIMEFLNETSITLRELASYLNVSMRMIQKKDFHDKFSTSVSERALLIGKLYARGEEVFGSIENFHEWMNTENPSMGYSKPKSYLDTYSGTILVMNKLTGIEHGFPA